MRYLAIGCVSLLLILQSCKKETLAPTDKLNETADTTAMLHKVGTFESGPYGTVTGKAKIYKHHDGRYQLALDSFNTDNGPDLYVYLSKEIMPVNFISLGKLKSTMGSQVYDITGTVNYAEYKCVSIHCQQHNHLFGYALLP